MEQIVKLRVGSHLYGTNTPESDEDYMGVFMPDQEHLLGLKKVEEVDMSTKKSNSEKRNDKDDVDYKSYAFHKFMHLLLQNNPNIVETVFVNDKNVLETSDIWKDLIANKNKVISQRVSHTFMGYAFSQKKKLTIKSSRYNSLNDAITYLEKKFALYELISTSFKLDEDTASDLNKHIKYYKGLKNNCESFHKGMPLNTVYGKLKYELETYGWRVKTDTFETLGYDIKFGYHLIRILAEGFELLSTGELHFPISGEGREDIIRVRNGEVELDELLLMYEKWEEKCKSIDSKLPHKPDFNWANEFVINKTLEHLRK